MGKSNKSYFGKGSNDWTIKQAKFITLNNTSKIVILLIFGKATELSGLMMWNCIKREIII